MPRRLRRGWCCRATRGRSALTPRIAAVAAALAVAAAGAVTPSAPALAAAQVGTVPARSPQGALIGPAVTVATRSFPAGARFVSASVSVVMHRRGGITSVYG